MISYPSHIILKQNAPNCNRMLIFFLIVPFMTVNIMHKIQHHILTVVLKRL